MQKLKIAFRKLLVLLGLAAPPPPPPPPPTKLQTALDKYKSLSDSEKPAFVERIVTEAATVVATVQKAVASQTQDVVLTTSDLFTQVKSGLESAEVAMYFLGEQAKSQAAPQDMPETERQLLELQALSKLLAPLAIPGKSWMQKFEQYVELHEEQLLLTEARGEYKFKMSENKEWIKLPLLQFLNKGESKDVARKELLQFFYDCPQIGLMELDTKVPMLPTDLIDVHAAIASKRVTPLYLREKDEWFLLVV